MKYTSQPIFRNNLNEVVKALNRDPKDFVSINFSDNDLEVQFLDSKYNVRELHACVEDFCVSEFREDLISSKLLETTNHMVEIKYLCLMAKLFGEEYIEEYDRWARRLKNADNDVLISALREHDRATARLRAKQIEIQKLELTLAKRKKSGTKKNINSLEEIHKSQREKLSNVRGLDRLNLWRTITYKRDFDFHCRMQNVSMMRAKLKI